MVIYTDASFRQDEETKECHAGISCSFNQEGKDPIWLVRHIRVTSNGRAEAKAIEMALKNLSKHVSDDVDTVTILNDNLPLVTSINGETDNHMAADACDIIQRIQTSMSMLLSKRYNKLLASGYSPSEADEKAKDSIKIMWIGRQENHVADAMAYHALTYLPLFNSKQVVV